VKIASIMLFTAFAIACSRANGTTDPGAASGATKKPPPAATPARAAMEITYRDLPDDKWKHAAELVVAACRDVLAQAKAVRAAVGPFKSPDGAMLPYLLVIESTMADGSPAFRSTAVVLGDKLATGGGPAAVTGVLAAAGFPASHVTLGHMLELLYLTGAIDLTWFSPTSAIGWDGVGRPLIGSALARSLEYTRAGAVLHLYRGSASATASGGYTAPSYERLDVTFTDKATFTTAVLRQNAGKTAWEVVH
jgi:hypothetical protein